MPAADPTTAPVGPTVLRVRTRAATHDRPLLDLLPRSRGALSWVRGGDGLVGWGVAATVVTAGPHRAADADRWWRETAAAAEVDDAVGVPGTGAVAFVSLAFADAPGTSVCVVPRFVAGRRDGVDWVTEIAPVHGVVPDEPAPEPVRAPTGLVVGPDDPTTWRAEVATAVATLRAEPAGPAALRKVVLARDLHASADADLDERHLLTALAGRFPTCWTYAVSGLVGATPELLLRRRGRAVDSQVLAGTSWPDAHRTAGQAAAALLTSGKNLAEHRYAVGSLLDALGPVCASVDAGPVEVLELPGLAHLATRVHGELADGATSLLALATRVHPTAAVGGTPTERAVALIAELESVERGRFAGPVGWVDAAGDGELGVALRCAEVDGRRARLLAGCGIVADSDPDTEVAESVAKLAAVRGALES